MTRTTRCTRTLRLSLLIVATVALGIAPVDTSEARRRSPLKQRSFAVVAVVDTGINPYHLDFRRTDLKAHPSTYVSGFPRTAKPLRLSFGAPDLMRARAADAKEWESMSEGELRWIPGTNIIGFYGARSIETPGFDDQGHGTGVASVAAGMRHGPGRADILIVSVEGTDAGLEWASRQPWIDVITNSWSVLIPVTDQTAEASFRAVESGKVVCFASGNAHVPLILLEAQGPSWNVNVGAASSKSRTERYYTGYPNDVLGLSGFDSAAADSMDGTQEFGGTSAAAPFVCSRIAQALASTRRALGDTREGPHGGGLALGAPVKGYLDDGLLTRSELEDAIQSTATPASSQPDANDPYTVPALPGAPFLRGGYGIVDDDSMRLALDVIFGASERPTRTAEDAWLEATDAVRNLLWGPPPP